MEEFFTRDKANEGIKLPLYLPTGEKSEHTMTILGVDSDEYHKAMITIKRSLFQVESSADIIEDKVERLKYLDGKQVENERIVIAALISDWSLEQECSTENKLNFLTNAPQIAEAINRAACSRKLFFGKG